jgi:hypothetical protein
MRLAAIETVIRFRSGFRLIDLTEEGWTRATVESRWFETGDNLAKNYQETPDGLLVDRDGRYHSKAA